MRIPENSCCPNCAIVFTALPLEDRVACPACGTLQCLPIVQLDASAFYCCSCDVRFGSAADGTIKCHQCGEVPHVEASDVRSSIPYADHAAEQAVTGEEASSSDGKATVLSCIQPTGDLHLGNYFGAIANWVKLQDRFECLYGVVDLHAMTSRYEPSTLSHYTESMLIDLLACGLDPNKSILFVQSMIPEHAELSWILNCVCSFGDLTRQTQFKEKSEQLAEGATAAFVSSGLFTYPVLQAADILIYRARYVPVGRDQIQHLELTRAIARRFNERFGVLFAEPQALLTDVPKLQSLADPNQKMSKSLGAKHYVGLFESDDSVRSKIRSAVTDTGGGLSDAPLSHGVNNLLAILNACGRTSDVNAFVTDFGNGQRQYNKLKIAVTDAVLDLTRSLRARRDEIGKDKEGTLEAVRRMSDQARARAVDTLREVRKLVGLPRRNW